MGAQGLIPGAEAFLKFQVVSKSNYKPFQVFECRHSTSKGVRVLPPRADAFWKLQVSKSNFKIFSLLKC